MEDGKIIDLYLERDESALEYTAEKYGSRLNALAFHIVCDRQSAEECENDCYLKAWNSIPPHQPRDYFYAFLARITRHIAIDLCRKNSSLKRNALTVELGEELKQCLPASDAAQQGIEAEALGRILNGFLGSLSEDKRNIFVRRYWYLDSVSEISKRFGYSESKVKTTLMRCREKLRGELTKEGFDI